MRRIIVLMMVLIFAVACTQSNTTGQTIKTKALDNGEEVVVRTNDVPTRNQDTTEVVVKGTNGNTDVVVTGNPGTGDWCSEGADWSWVAAGQGSAKWNVIGIEALGKYQGLCHIVYEIESPEGSTKMNYYIAENGETGYLEMETPDGQTFTQEWKK